MSKENAKCDVKITKYACTQFNMIRVKFWNDCELLPECGRVVPVVKKTKLYFVNGDNITESIKFSGKDNSVLQITRNYDKIKKFEGEYDLKNDPQSNEYYIDLNEKLGAPNYRDTDLLGKSHASPGTSNREKRDLTGLIHLTDQGEACVNKITKVKEDDERWKQIGFCFDMIDKYAEDPRMVRSTLAVLKDMVRIELGREVN